MLGYDAAGRSLNLGPELARGGEGVVYAVSGQPAMVAKVYVPRPRDGHEEKLRWMLAHPPQDPGRPAPAMREATRRPHAAIAWPHNLLFDAQRRFIGYMMPYVQDATAILMVFNPRSRAQTMPGFDRRYLHRAARNMAAAMGALHEGNYIVGDLNESNVLVTPSALVTLIDADSFQAQEPRQGRIIVYPCPVGKAEYTAPELQRLALVETLRQPQHDDFALAVLVFQLLMEGSHPFRARWLGSGDPPPLEERIRRGYFPFDPKCAGIVAPAPGVPSLDTLHPALVDLACRCFVDGHEQPNRRPAAHEWERALAEAEQTLVQCSAGHIYSGHLPACPTCGSKQASRTGIAGRRTGMIGSNPPRHTARPAPPQVKRQPQAVSASPPKAGGLQSATGAAPASTAYDDWLFRMAGKLALSLTVRMWRGLLHVLANRLTLQPAGAPGQVTIAGQARPVRLICSGCGTVSGPDEIYCQHCNAQLSGSSPCPRCGDEMPQNSRYCPHCGIRIQ